MTQHKKCSIAECAEIYYARGWCHKHYERNRINGHTDLVITAQLDAFIEQALSSETDECIEWPFSRTTGDGYGLRQIENKRTRVTQVVCEKVHGPRPSKKHEVAHSCRNPPCINKRHLRWATRKENQEDQVLHGTDVRGERHGLARLSECDVRNIRAEYAKCDISQQALAQFFAINQSVISKLCSGKSWAHTASRP